MERLYEALTALYRLGAVWTARRVSRGELFDTIICSTLVQADGGVFRGSVEVHGIRHQDRRVKAEITCYLGGCLKENGSFETKSYPKAETVKLYEYQNIVLMEYSGGFLGVGRGFRPSGPVPA